MKTTFEKRRGRKIVVDGVNWKYVIGRCNIVAHSENGERKHSDLSVAKYGKYTDSFYDDRYDLSRHGSLTPSDIEKWLKRKQ